jgi:2-oxoglutarate ferredoxin oxidoreductase subunit alpha
MEDKTLNILIGGEAGQGLVTVGYLLTKSLVRSGYFVVVTQDYQSRIRGGHNTFAIRVSTEEIVAPRRSGVDLLVALDAETVRLHQKQLTPHGFIVADEAFGVADQACLSVPFKELSARKFTNIVALGVVSSLLGLEESLVFRAIERFFGKKDEKVVEENQQALRKSFEWCGGQPCKAGLEKLPPVKDFPKRLMINGNEAIALGALSGGVKFYAFYPMTPSTSIGQSLAAVANRMGLIVEQGEDEIAVMNMALGASFAGAPSMVSTSGGGFALMVEGVSLAGMTETPVVIVVAQRPGPATGLPTRTEQGDLELVLHSGHGEFPRAIFTPGTVEECFHLTRKALQLAERYQGPVFILTDQFLADSYRAIAPFDLEELSAVQPPGDEPDTFSEPYRRHAMAADGVSPRLLPGLSKHLVVTDSDEHTEDGHITEDHGVRRQMVQKRLKKAEGIRSEVVPPEAHGDENPELLLISWGSSKGAVREAATELRSDGQRVATLHFSQVWPLVSEQFVEVLEKAGEVVCVEGNATGQLARLIRRETGFVIEKKVLRYDGLPFTPEYILRELKETREEAAEIGNGKD